MANGKFSAIKKPTFWSIVISFSLALSACSPDASKILEVPKELCDEVNATIDRNIAAIAISEAEGELQDKSAMQQGARMAQNNNRYSTILINIQLQGQNKCPARKRSIDTSVYSANASACASARFERQLAFISGDEGKRKTAMEKVASACDFKAWSAGAAK